LPDNVLNSYIDEFGLQDFQTTFRGIHEQEGFTGRGTEKKLSKTEQEISDAGYTIEKIGERYAIKEIGERYAIKENEKSILSTGETIEEAWEKAKNIIAERAEKPKEGEPDKDLTKVN